MGPESMARPAPGASPTRWMAATRISLAIADELRVPGASGLIESVHRSAINVRWNGDLLTIAHESVGCLPNGLLVAGPVALDQIGLRVGMSMQADATTLWAPTAARAISLSAAASWSPAMPAQSDLPPVLRAARAERALQVAAFDAPQAGLGPLLVALAGRSTAGTALGATVAACLIGVVEALRGGGADRSVAAAFPLIGLGPGATPSGDDLLVGLAAGLAATGHRLARPFAAGVALAARGRTTSLAEAFLAHAGRLQFAERVHRAALGVLSDEEGEMRAAVGAALSWGASSGADLLVGLLLGIQADAPGLQNRLRACAVHEAVAA